MSIAGIVARSCGNFESYPKQRGNGQILHPERIVGNSEVMAEVAPGPDKRRKPDKWSSRTASFWLRNKWGVSSGSGRAFTQWSGFGVASKERDPG
jgi:hypothetical protein